MDTRCGLRSNNIQNYVVGPDNDAYAKLFGSRVVNAEPLSINTESEENKSLKLCNNLYISRSGMMATSWRN